MPFQVIPGVNVSEIDLTTIVPSVATSTGAIAGLFRWGPVGERVFVDTETKLLLKNSITDYVKLPFGCKVHFIDCDSRVHLISDWFTKIFYKKLIKKRNNN